MPCNCGKNAKKEYVYTTPEGHEQIHPTLVAAKAAKIRAGGVGSVREQAKR